MTDRILNKMIHLNIINAEEADIYRFGMETLELKLLHYISYLFIAVLCGEVFNFCLFFMAFLLLRKNAGGCHSETKTGCYFLSCFTVLGAMLIMKYVVLQNAVIFSGIVLLLVADILIYRLAPLGNRNRELNDKEIIYFRKRTRQILIVENSVIFACLVCSKKQYALPFILAVICQAVLLMLQKRKDYLREKREL